MRWNNKQRFNVQRKRMKKDAADRINITNFFLAMIDGSEIENKDRREAYVAMKEDWLLH